MHTSAELKPIRIAVPTVLGQLRCGHITSVYCGMGWRELFWKQVRQLCRVLRRMRSPVVVLKLGFCMDQPFVLLGTRKLVLEMLSFKMNLCRKKWFSAKVNLNLILELPCALYSVYSPSVGVIGLIEYICTHPILNFYRGRPRLRSRGR